jgi:hypothetical protein
MKILRRRAALVIPALVDLFTSHLLCLVTRTAPSVDCIESGVRAEVLSLGGFERKS